MSKSKTQHIKRNKRTTFTDSYFQNNFTFYFYYDRIYELAVSRFRWENMPDEIDKRFLEMTLFNQGQALFYKDDFAGEYVALPVLMNGNWNIYNIPKKRRAYATNGYFYETNSSDSVVIFNNYIRQPSIQKVQFFASRLAAIQRAIDINLNTTKTPVIIQCSEDEKLSLNNLWMKYDGNEPVIFVKNSMNLDDAKVLKLDAPFLADKLQKQKTDLWNEMLTWLGFSNISINKAERLITDEVERNQGGVVASRNSPLKSREEACEKINKMFGLNLHVYFEENADTSMPNDNIESETVLEEKEILNE